ncbi:hypothetical protein ACI65C_012789 [Semiaphis heraclei]
MGNPSDHVETPLTGGYLLIVLAEPRSAEHKLAILKKLTKGLSCWNYEESGVDIVAEFNAIVNQNIEGEEGKNGIFVILFNFYKILKENLLASFTKYRCIIHAGYSFTENGSWILQDGSFSVTDFLDAYKTAEAQRTIRLHENKIRTELYCSGDADWNQVSRVKGTRFLINPAAKIVENESIESIVRWLCDKIEVAELDILLEGSQVVGNIRFSRPTLYVFPAGQGDSALFGINGFNMLIDGGAGRNSCFWGFARHLDRLDAVLLTRLNSTNLEGVASFLKRKTMSSLYPQIGHFFCNFKTRKQISSPNVDAKQDILSISLIDTAQSIITDLKQLQLRPHLCYRNINLEPINLYHKVGHGKLDMYVLNPSKDSKEVKDFLAKWNEGDQKLFNPTKDLQFPLPNIISVCTLLVWQPANPNTTITRILFPGSSPQNKIFESLERVRHLDFLKHPSCSIKSMSSSTSATVKSQTTKKTVLEKMIPGETKTVKTMENLEVSTSASNAVIQTAIIPTVPKEGTPKPKFTVETEKPKPNIKSVMKETANAKPKIDHKYSSISAKVNSNKVVQKSSITKKSLKLSSKSPPTDKSSPTTPIENQEKITKPVKQVIKPKSTTTTTKSPSITPTKSKKEEANRKVLVSSRTNSGLKRTQITKKDTKSANPKFMETKLKKDSNIVYKSSLISCNKDKSGEEEDILIVEKVAITPEKLLTPDGKKLIANELDGILTTAKDIVIKEKLSDSGATTAPTMPEDEKITESKKEIDLNESDKKNEEFKKAKDALKTPDEVADLPFHEEADEQKPKVAEKEIESEIETQEIVQVENAEYVLVSLDSSPEVLKRQVLDTVDLSDTEIDEDSDKEDECVETKQGIILPDIDEKTKLIEHLLESSKDLCEITDKIDELKKQNENEITNHQIHDHLQNYNHDSTKTSNICSQSNKQENPTQIQSCTGKSGSVCDEPVKSPVHETITTDNAVQSRSGSVTEHQGSIQDNVTDMQKSKASSKASSICDEPIKSPVHETKLTANAVQSRSASIIDEPEIIPDESIDIQKSKASSNASLVCDEPVKSPVQETITTANTISSRSCSITEERDITKEISIKSQESKASSKANSVCDETVKSPVHETVTTATEVSSRSNSVTDNHGNIQDNVNDMQKSKASSKASSVCDEPVKSPVHEIITTANAVQSRSGSVTEHRGSIQDNVTDMQKSKASSKASSICDEPVKSPIHETITLANVISSRSGSITEKLETTKEIPIKSQESKASSKANSVCDETVKSPVHETVTTANAVQSRSGSVTEHNESILDNVTDMQKSKASSKASSICDEPINSPVNETKLAANAVQSRSGSIIDEQQIISDNIIDMQKSKASSRASSVCDEPVKSPVHETNTTATEVSSGSNSVTENHGNIQDIVTDMQKSKASSKASSICDEPINSPVNETKLAANAVQSRSGSIIDEQQIISDNIIDMQKSKASSKASSVCDEPVKSPVHEIITTANAVQSRSGSVTEHRGSIQDNVTDMQKSKASSKASSICDEPIKSPVDEIKSAANAVQSRSGSIIDEQETISDNIIDMQKSKASSRASSVCDEPVKSPVHETNTTATEVSSGSNSVTENHGNIQDNVTDMQKSKASSKASSICDEPINSPVNETKLAANAVQSRSGSIIDEQQIISDNIIDMQKSKASSRASSVCDEPVKSPVHETNTTATEVSSGSNSVTENHGNIQDIVTDIQKSKASSKASSICDEPINSPVNETKLAANAVQSRSGSIIDEQQIISDNIIDMQKSKASSKASSVCDEPVKSPVHEIITTANAVQSRSGSVTEHRGSIQDNVTDMQKSKASSKASSICDEPIKSPVDEIKSAANAVQSRSGSIIDEQETISDNFIDMQKSKASSKASSVCDEPVKSPVHEIITTANAVQSRSGSVTEHRGSIQDNVTDMQKSKASSKASSICDEPIKSPVDEIKSAANAVQSRSGSIIDEQETISDNFIDMQKSKASSRASSVCDEPVKSPVHEIITTANAVQSRSGSVTEHRGSIQDNVTDMQKSKASSKASSVCDEMVKSLVHETVTTATEVSSRSGSTTEEREMTKEIIIESQESKESSKANSVCDETVKSPFHETITTANEVQSRSGSILNEQEIILDNIIDMQKSKASSRASSVCDEPDKSPIQETITTANEVQSRSGSIIDEQEIISDNIIDMQKSKASSKASSICDEPVKSPVHETVLTANAIQSRSGSVTEHHESILDNVNDIQKSKGSSKSGSICDEPVKSPVHETITTATSLSSRSGSVTEEREITKEITIKSQESKASNKADSDCETVKSPVHETVTTANAVQCRSGSVTANYESILDNVTDIQKSKESSKAGSICDEPVKSPVHETITTATSVSSRSGSVTEEREITKEIIIESQESKASSKANTVCDETVKPPVHETIVGVISSRTNSGEELLESIPIKNNCFNVDDIMSNISLKEQESMSTLLTSGNSSLSQDTEYTHIIGLNKQDVEQCSIKDSFFQDKNKSSTFSSSSTSSICQDTQSSKLSSRKSSVVDESTENPSKLQIGEKSSSLQESNVYEHDNDNNYKILNKSGSLCDEMLNLSSNKVTENIISNKAYEQAVSPDITVGKTGSKIANEVELMCEESIKSHNDEICTKENLISSASSSILHEIEEEKCQIQKKNSEFDEPQNFVTEDTKTILSSSNSNKNKPIVIERKTEESKSLGRIGSLCEEIAKFLTDNDGKTSNNITSELPCNLIESIPLESNIEESEVETETFLQLNKNTDTVNKVEKSLELDDVVKVDEKNEKNTDHSLPVENITVSNNKSPNISTLLIEENNKTGILNVAQLVGKNVSDESLIKYSVITDNETKNLKTVSPISNMSSGECISKLSNMLIEDVAKTSDDKNIICDSSMTDICMNQPLGVTLNSEDLGVTKDTVMQLKRDVHEALHQCSSDDERPFTPHSESSMSRSAMNIDDDDDDNEDNKIETDDDMPGSPMSTGPPPVQMQLDNRHVEINMDFNKAMQEHRITRGEDLTNTEANGNHVTEIKTTEHDNINQNQGTSSDTVQSWGKPLGLPPVQSINNNGFDPIREWGKPLGLPSPTQPILELAEPQNMSSKTTPKKNVKKIIDNKPIINVMDKDTQNRIRRSESPSKLRSRSSSRMSRIYPVYLDLIYVPHHGNSKYVSADFFKRVRARNYVFSGTDPSKEVLNALIEGKQTWEDQDLEVTIIPTYDTDTLGQWVAENEELLTKLKIDLSPSASRCTIKLQDHNTSCSAYRLEF